MSEALILGGKAVAVRAAGNSVVRRIARKEAGDLYRDGRVLCAIAAVAFLVLASIALSWQDFREREASRAQIEKTVRLQWENQGEKHPHSAAHFGQYAFTPSSIPAAIDPGTLSHTGTAVWLEPHRRNLFRFRPAEDQTPAVRYGTLTPALLLQALLPLLIIGLCFAAVAGEREAGTLRLTLSLGVTRGQLFAGKALGVALAGLPLALLIFIPFVVLGFAQPLGGMSGVDQALRLALLALVYCLYWSVWIFTALGVSCRARTAQSTLAVLLALWAAATMLAPQAGSFIAERFATSPSAQTFAAGIQNDLAKGLDRNSPPEKRYQELVAQTLKQYNVKSLDELPVGFGGIRLRSNDAYSEQVHDKHFSALYDNWRQQSRLYLLASPISPLIATRGLSQSLAGTDVEHHIHFAQAAEMYRREFINRTSDEVTALAKGNDWNVKSGADLWKSISSFDYHSPSVGKALRTQPLTIAVLLAWLAASVWFARRSFARLNFE